MAQGVGKAALGGAAKGAAMGAKIGSFIPIPGIGTAVGAGVGALIGGISGGIKKKKSNQAEDQQARTEAAADRKARRQAELNQREIDREARRRKLEFNIGDDSLISQNPQTNGTGGGNPTFSPQSFNTMAAVSDPKIDTYGSLFSKPVSPPMDDIQKSLQQKITSQT
mgnify:CR=1 FL=1|tara:strand:+ start:699 stop:1199 length:501 start_codon:yes stop_codon:yes gene_type:complete